MGEGEAPVSDREEAMTSSSEDGHGVAAVWGEGEASPIISQR